MLKKLAIPTSLLSAVLKFKEPHYYFCSPEVDTLTLNSDFPALCSLLEKEMLFPEMLL